MWIDRDFEHFMSRFTSQSSHPVKVLKGPRQVGKTSVLMRGGKYRALFLDDIHIRKRAQQDPKLFLDQFPEPILLDEAALVPELFLELKRRVDAFKREKFNKAHSQDSLDVWITGSNQTLLEKNVRESLAGRASYFDLNTLSVHELGHCDLHQVLIKGGWPELHSHPNISPVSYLNDLILTFIERDIVSAAGIERKAAFTLSIGLLAGRIGQLLNASDIAKNVGVDTTTIQSWIAKLEQNAILRTLRPYYSNLNQRLLKTPKIYFEDVGLASRFQGWTSYEPLFLSSQFGHLVENLALNEICRFFSNSGLRSEIFFIRSKEKVEVDFLIKLPNEQWIAAEVKSTPEDFTKEQMQLLKSLNMNIIEKWILTPQEDIMDYPNTRVISFLTIYDELSKLVDV